MSDAEAFEIEGVGQAYGWGERGKPLVVLLHGFMQTGRSWKRIAPLLGDHYVLAPDLLGHGKTSFSPKATLSLEDYVEQVHTLIAWARNTGLTGEIEPVDLVGYSLGGRIAALYGTLYPEDIAHLVLESAGLGPRDPEERAQRAQKSAQMIARLDDSLAADPAVPLSAFVDWWESLPLFASQAQLPAPLRASIREERLANNPAALRRNLEDAGQHRMSDLRPALVNLNKPLLYLVGERDVAYTEIARSLMCAWALDHDEANGFSTGFVQVSVIPGAGHNVHLEAPEEYAQLVGAFLRRDA